MNHVYAVPHVMFQASFIFSNKLRDRGLVALRTEVLPLQVGRTYPVPLCYTFMLQVHVMTCLNMPDGSLVLIEICVISSLMFFPPK